MHILFKRVKTINIIKSLSFDVFPHLVVVLEVSREGKLSPKLILFSENSEDGTLDRIQLIPNISDFMFKRLPLTFNGFLYCNQPLNMADSLHPLLAKLLLHHIKLIDLLIVQANVSIYLIHPAGRVAEKSSP